VCSSLPEGGGGGRSKRGDETVTAELEGVGRNSDSSSPHTQLLSLHPPLLLPALLAPQPRPAFPHPKSSTGWLHLVSRGSWILYRSFPLPASFPVGLSAKTCSRVCVLYGHHQHSVGATRYICGNSVQVIEYKMKKKNGAAGTGRSGVDS